MATASSYVASSTRTVPPKPGWSSVSATSKVTDCWPPSSSWSVTVATTSTPSWSRRWSCQVLCTKGRLTITTTSPTSRTFLSRPVTRVGPVSPQGAPHRAPWATCASGRRRRARCSRSRSFSGTSAGWPGTPIAIPAISLWYGRHAELVGDRGFVEAGELVRVQPHRAGLKGEVGGRLAGVVLRVEGLVAALAVLVGRNLRSHDEDRRGPRHPAGVAPGQVPDQDRVAGAAPLGDDERGRLGVAAARRPLRREEEHPQLVWGEDVGVVEDARAPARAHRLGQKGLVALGCPLVHGPESRMAPQRS